MERPVRLFASSGSAIASFWTEERSQKEFGVGDYRRHSPPSRTARTSEPKYGRDRRGAVKPTITTS
jgi:hypothetical protein